MVIRNVRGGDIREIRRISDDLSVGRFSRKQGFVEYRIPSHETYQRRMGGNPYFYVATNDDKVIGFLAAYADSFLDDFPEHDSIMKRVAEKPHPYVYADQIGVDEESQRKGFGYRLFERLITDASGKGYKTIWSAIIHHPLTNTNAINLLGKFKGQYNNEDISLSTGLTYGIYRIDL